MTQMVSAKSLFMLTLNQKLRFGTGYATAVKSTCKLLGIKDTKAAIHEFINSDKLYPLKG